MQNDKDLAQLERIALLEQAAQAADTNDETRKLREIPTEKCNTLVPNKAQKRPYLDLMLDLETLGTKPGSVILSIGAAPFGSHVANAPTFYTSIGMHDSQARGLKVDPKTLAWWQQQELPVKAAAFMGANPLIEALAKFTGYIKFLESLGFEVRVWGNSASFDCGILKAAYEAIGQEAPWKYYNEMCFRTLKNLVPASLTPRRQGMAHHALDDAIYQARWAEGLFKFLNLSWG